jgi:hypothetical protein
MSIWIFIGIIAAWFFLQAYLLPRLGISTWLRPNCQVDSQEISQTNLEKDDKNREVIK